MNTQNSIGMVDAINYEFVIGYLKTQTKFVEKIILNKLRVRVCSKLFDFIKQMKQTNLWKRKLTKNITKMKESIPSDMASGFTAGKNESKNKHESITG